MIAEIKNGGGAVSTCTRRFLGDNPENKKKKTEKI